MSWIPAPLPSEDDRTPVTVCLTNAQALRLEVLIATYRDRDPSADDNDVVDAVFLAGLQAAENAIDLEQPQ